MLQYRILGPLEVAANGTVADLGPPQQRAILAVLLLHANEIVSVDRLIDELWGGRAPRRAAHAIQVYVSGLRQALRPLAGREVIHWRAPGYVLDAEPASIDAWRSEHLLAEATGLVEAGEIAEAEVLLGTARDLWRGPPLSDFAYDEFAQVDIRHLTDVWLRGTEELAGVELRLHKDNEVLRLAEAAIREDPLRERPRELRMLSLCRLGRYADALRAYEDFRTTLSEELEIAPSPTLRRLQEQILLHDPSLGPPEAATTGLVPPRNPYKGLRSFGEADAADFFGREALVERLLDALRAGARMVALVGPSGSGKSSLLEAGLVPALRAGGVRGSGRWVVERVRPAGGTTGGLDLGKRGGAGERVLVIDQFEELFADPEADRILDDLTELARNERTRVRIIIALRADHYDRPLLHPDFAVVFVPAVVNVVPMTATEFQAAIVEPCRRIGVEVEPALLSELVADAVARPGALPLLQFVLTELFDRRVPSATRLTVDDYRALGGLRGALSRRAEDVFGGLDPARQEAARQILLRLVRLDDETRIERTRVLVGELATLDMDPVTIHDALRALDVNRLVSFDRDTVTGGATVEVAHDALLSEWGRLKGWIEAHRSDIRFHQALAARVREWEASNRGTDDLLTGVRLDDCSAWAAETTIRLTASERAFLDASVEERNRSTADAHERERQQRRLEGQARLRLVALIGTLVLLLAAVAYGLTIPLGTAPDMVLVYPGPGEMTGTYDGIAAGLNAAISRNGIDAQTVIETGGGLESRLRRLAAQGVELIVVGFRYANPEVVRVARDYPATRFLALDYVGTLPNVSAVDFARQEGSYLVGTVAALRSRTATIGIVVDADTDLDWPFVGGFEAGALAVNPGTEVLVEYLGRPPDYLVTYSMVNQAAQRMYRAGADIVFYGGDWAALGVFEAAFSESGDQGRHLWAIAIDTDWYVALPMIGLSEGRPAEAWRPHVLTSLITRYDRAFETMVDAYAQGTLAGGRREFGLGEDAFDLASSGGFIDDLQPRIEALRAQIVAGEIVVPPYPENRAPPGVR